jgi:protoporphyrinogen oxidase
LLRKALPQPAIGEENFATVMRRGLGNTICDKFYYPYAEKLWGLPPEELAVTLAKRRVSAGSINKILRKIANQVPGLRTETTGHFFYPRRGFGEICERLHQAAAMQGADFIFDARVSRICRDGDKVTAICLDRMNETHSLPVDFVWSTLPIGLLVRLMDPPAPAPVLEAAKRIRFRGMILIYLVLPQDRFSEFDAHYFPDQSIPISRMSEPKNYSGTNEPIGRTVLCAELPSDPHEEAWSLNDAELGNKLCAWLASVGLKVAAPPVHVATRRLRHAYPIYDKNYETHFRILDDWLGEIDGLLTFGRQGLFAHDNTHHALAVAYAASDCLDAHGRFDKSRWADYRLEFDSHVVED